MNRRNFFSNFLRTAAAITVASSMEVFGSNLPKSISFLDPSFTKGGDVSAMMKFCLSHAERSFSWACESRNIIV